MPVRGSPAPGVGLLWQYWQVLFSLRAYSGFAAARRALPPSSAITHNAPSAAPERAIIDLSEVQIFLTNIYKISECNSTEFPKPTQSAGSPALAHGCLSKLSLHPTLPPLERFQGGLQVRPEVVGAFQPDMQPDHPARFARLAADDVRRNPHRQGQALEAAPTAPDAKVAQRVDEAIGCLPTLLFELDAEQAAGAVQLTAGQFALGIGRQGGIVDDGDGRMVAEGLGDTASVLLVPLHTDRQGAQTAQQQPGSEGVQHCAEQSALPLRQRFHAGLAADHHAGNDVAVPAQVL